jgi:HAD superfamily hydrolase (TIGR01509 family)
MKTILVDAVDTFIIEGEGIFQEMYKLLEEYPNKKIILTNANDEQMKIFGLDSVPYEVFTLKHEPNKPDPKYFETMLKHFDFKAEDVIYFEHDEEAVKSAQSLNITSYHYDKDKKDLVALKNFLDNNL